MPGARGEKRPTLLSRASASCAGEAVLSRMRSDVRRSSGSISARSPRICASSASVRPYGSLVQGAQALDQHRFGRRQQDAVVEGQVGLLLGAAGEAQQPFGVPGEQVGDRGAAPAPAARAAGLAEAVIVGVVRGHAPRRRSSATRVDFPVPDMPVSRTRINVAAASRCSARVH